MQKSFVLKNTLPGVIRILTIGCGLTFLLICGGYRHGIQAQGPGGGPTFIRIRTGDVTRVGGASGASWVDFDNDGDLDLFTVGAPTNPPPLPPQRRVLYRNDGNDTFTSVAIDTFANEQGLPIGNSWGDYDNDGDLDVFIAGNPSVLYRNEGNANFTKITTGDIGMLDSRGWSPAWGDIDQDGNLDLFITHPAGFTGNPATSNHLFLNDGPPDYMFTKTLNSAAVRGFAPYTNASWSDFDQDGDLDLSVGAGPANGTVAPDFFYRNMLRETGTIDLQRITEGTFATDARDGQTVNWIDYDNDGDLDVYITNWGGTLGGLPNDLYRNDGATFTKITEGEIVTDSDVSLANVWGDFDNDGDLDAFVANNGLNRYYQNNGDGTFTRVNNILRSVGINWGATAGDYDNDGDLDLFIPVLLANQPHGLFRNDTANGNHWLKIKCVGTASNRAAIGAKIRVRATINGKPVGQMREISSQNSFMGHNSLDVHFGLGDATIVESLIIEWPSGLTEGFTNVAVDQFLNVTEGNSLNIGGGKL